MKKLTAALFFLTLVLSLGAIGNQTSTEYGPECVVVGEVQQFRATVDFASPDGERLIFAQFKTGDFWDIGAVQNPASVDVPGTWHHQVNQAGNVISWWFTANSGIGGDVGAGGSITFTFNATVDPPGDLDVMMYIEGDTNGGPPHTKSWTYTYPECADDDDDDDDTTADDDNDDDAADDDAADDDAADDDAADDDAADDDDDNGDDDDDDDDNGCGC